MGILGNLLGAPKDSAQRQAWRASKEKSRFMVGISRRYQRASKKAMASAFSGDMTGAAAQSGEVSSIFQEIHNFLSKRHDFQIVMTRHAITSDDIKSIIASLNGYHATGGADSTYAHGHYIPISALMFPDTLSYMMRAVRGQIDQYQAMGDIYEYFIHDQNMLMPELQLRQCEQKTDEAAERRSVKPEQIKNLIEGSQLIDEHWHPDMLAHFPPHPSKGGQKTIIACQNENCGQQLRVPSGRELKITCPACKICFVHHT